MITYNHEPYISQAIEGILAQETTYPVELIISEDCSTDNTRKIVLEYAKEYPDIIVVDLPDKNRGMNQNALHNFSLARGKYIALCEGDDYWTDPLKLQKQIDFLSVNPEYGMCYTDYRTVDMQGSTIYSSTHSKHIALSGSGDIFGRLLNINFIQTLTVCFRKEIVDFDFTKDRPNVDLLLFGMIAGKSKCHFIADITGCYRINQSGAIRSNGNMISAVLKQTSRFLVECYVNGYFPRRKFLKHIEILYNSADMLLRYIEFEDNRRFLFSKPQILLLSPIALFMKLYRRFKYMRLKEQRC